RLGSSLPDATFDALQRYDDAEFLALVQRVGEQSGLNPPVVLEKFGEHLFGRFAALYPVFFVDAESAPDLLRRINTYVHGELKKLYRDAEFPPFEVREPSSRRLELVYRSRRPLADLADGMIRGCVAHFGKPIRVERHDPPGADGHEARFVLVAAPSSRRRSRG